MLTSFYFHCGSFTSAEQIEEPKISKIKEENLKNLTIIILSKDRKASLTKVLKFWDKLPVKVVVVDGSPPSNNLIPNNSKLVYIQNQGTFLERLRMSCELITTDYVVLACDDELYIPSTLLSCIEFLNNNSDYMSCCGQAVGIATLDPVPVWVDVYPKLNNFDLNYNSGITRMNKHLASYVPASYFSVMRSEDWIKIWKNISRIEFTPFGIQELQFEVLAAFNGKIRALPELMWIRNQINDPIREEKMSGFDPKIRIGDWWYDAKAAEEKSLFISSMGLIIETFSKEKNLSSDHYNKIIEKSFQNYVDFYNKAKNPIIIIKIVRKIKKFWNELVSLLISKILRSIIPAATYTSMIKLIQMRNKTNYEIQKKFNLELRKDNSWLAVVLDYY